MRKCRYIHVCSKNIICQRCSSKAPTRWSTTRDPPLFTPPISSTFLRPCRANFIHKCFLPRDVQTYTCLYCLCPPSVRVWFLCLVSTFQERLIELNQCSVASQNGYVSWIIPQRLISLDLESLEVKRLRHCLLLTYKIVCGLINIDSSKKFYIATW